MASSQTHDPKKRAKRIDFIGISSGTFKEVKSLKRCNLLTSICQTGLDFKPA
jgi:hypothetical protein